MTRLSDFRIINTLLVFAVVLAGCGGGGGGGGAAPTSMPPTNVGRNPTPMPPVVVTPPVVDMTPMLQTFDAGTPTAAELTGAGGNDVWTIAGDATGNSPALDINGLVQAGGGEAIGGHEGDEHAAFTLSGGAVDVSIVYGTTTEATYTLEGAGTVGSITSGFASNTFILRTDITGDDPALRLGGAFINTGASGEFRIETGGVAGRIDFTPTPAVGSIGLQNIDTITIDGGTVNGAINASGARAGVTFNLVSGVAGNTDITGSGRDDIFIIVGSIIGATPDLDINGLVQGGGGNRDEVRLGADGVVRFLAFDRFFSGDLSLRDVEIITLNGGRVDGRIDVRGAPAGVIFNLLSGQIGNRGPAFPPGFVTGSTFDDIFIIGPNIVLNGGIFSGPTFPRGLASPIGVIDGGDGMDILRLARNFNVDEAIFLGQVLTLTFSGRRIQFTLINVEDIDIAGLITTLPSPPLLPPDYTLGTPDTFFMAGGEFEVITDGMNVLEVTSLGFTNLNILGTTIEGSRIGSNFVSLNFAPQDIRQAWVDGWTGSASPVLVVDSFGAGERHGYLVMLSVLTSSVIAPLFALEAGFTEARNNFGDDGGLRAALNDDGFAGADIRAIPFAVINASFGRIPGADPVERERRISDVEQFDDFYLELIGRGVFLSVANVMDAVITKAAGNDATDAGFEPHNVAYARNASIGPRLLIVGATEGYYDQDGGASIASYSNFAGSDPVIRARFIVANGDSPLSEAAFINNRFVSTEGRGTSYAAPRVAGYVALLRHKFPNLTANYSADIILDTATYEGLSCAPDDCRENIYGQGRVDIARALAPVGSMR